MAITAYSGPIGQFGTVMTTSAATGLLGADIEHNSQRAPMFSDLGDMMMDPRVAYAYQPGSGVTAKTFGFYNNNAVIDYVPVAINTSAFATSTQSSTGVTTWAIPSTIGILSSQGLTATTIIAPETGKATTGTLLAIDSTAAYLTFGSDGTIVAWNPAAGAGRCIVINTSSSGDGGTFSIAGRDMYGFKMTETITVAQGTSNNGAAGYAIKTQKAFKYVTSITNTTTPTSTGISIGFGDQFGFPMYSPVAGTNSRVWFCSSANNTAILSLSTANFILPQASTATATSTTADVRGIYISSVATNNVIRIQMVNIPTAVAAAAITSTNVAPFFGATQFSSV